MRSALPEHADRWLVKAPFQFRREQIPLTAPADGEYLVRVDVCGVCRSDLHVAQHWARDWQEVGHEFGGTIVAAGRAGARFGIGDRVAVRNASSCGECAACRSGASRACARLVVNMQGFRDYAVCDERSLVDAAGLDDDALALVEPMNVALDLLHAADLHPAHRVIVLGAGTLGLLTAYCARQVWRASDTIVIGRAPASPLATALEVGPYVPFEQADPPSGRGTGAVAPADRVLVTTPPPTLATALKLCRHRGSVLTVGLDDFERCRIELDASRLIFRQQTLTGVCAAPNAHFPQAIDLLRAHGKVLRQLIGRRTPRRDLAAALRAWHDRAHYDGKTIIVGGEEGR